jgi:D-alanyl-D-alanine carboxypeptidase
MKAIFTFLTSCLISFNVVAQNKFEHIVEPELNDYYHKYKDIEYFSGMGFSIGVKDYPVESYYIGQDSREVSSSPVTENSLFQIGSITKSYTAARVLQLDAQGKLKLSDTLSSYLPQYSKWGSVTISQLLDMSSGLPNYSESPTWNAAVSKNIEAVWDIPELVNFVYPKENFNPPLIDGYYYTNTGYVLVDMIIKQLTHESFKKGLENKIIKPLKLANTYYPVPHPEAKVKKRLMHGYGYNQYENPELVGVDMQLNSMTWAGAAGGIVSNAPGIVHWVQDLFIKDKLLTQSQKTQLTKMVSLKTGRYIPTTTEEDPLGFGLGVIQRYSPDLGRIWYYQGQTLGFRAMYMYIPCNQVVVAVTVNSSTNGENNHIHNILQDVYTKFLDAYPQYKCQS